MEHYKFFTPFFKEKSELIIRRWLLEMDEYVKKTIESNPSITAQEAKFQWLFLKMAEQSAMAINAEIAEDWKKKNLPGGKFDFEKYRKYE